MVVCISTLQIMAVSLLVLKRGLSPGGFELRLFTGVWISLRVYYVFFKGVFSNLGLVSNPWLSNPLGALYRVLAIHGGLET